MSPIQQIKITIRTEPAAAQWSMQTSSRVRTMNYRRLTCTLFNKRLRPVTRLMSLSMERRGGSLITYSHRSALRTQDISSISLGGKDFTNSPLFLTWTLNYTDALQDRPDEAEYSLNQNFDSHHNLSGVSLADITHDWRRNDDRQYLGKLDGTYHLTSDGTQTIQARRSGSGAKDGQTMKTSTN